MPEVSNHLNDVVGYQLALSYPLDAVPSPLLRRTTASGTTSTASTHVRNASVEITYLSFRCVVVSGAAITKLGHHPKSERSMPGPVAL
jgi:hypothetical protein